LIGVEEPFFGLVGKLLWPENAGSLGRWHAGRETLVALALSTYVVLVLLFG
jgi:hypothetical protein